MPIIPMTLTFSPSVFHTNQGNLSSGGFCIPLEKRCNRKADCPGGEDERDCPPTRYKNAFTK